MNLSPELENDQSIYRNLFDLQVRADLNVNILDVDMAFIEVSKSMLNTKQHLKNAQ